jgi:hypothetical protein
MTKWIVFATPIPGRASGTETHGRKGLFASDDAAKHYLRDMAKRHFAVRLSSAPEVQPAVHMEHQDALRWAHS